MCFGRQELSRNDRRTQKSSSNKIRSRNSSRNSSNTKATMISPIISSSRRHNLNDAAPSPPSRRRSTMPARILVPSQSQESRIHNLQRSRLLPKDKRKMMTMIPARTDCMIRPPKRIESLSDGDSYSDEEEEINKMNNINDDGDDIYYIPLSTSKSSHSSRTIQTTMRRLRDPLHHLQDTPPPPLPSHRRFVGRKIQRSVSLGGIRERPCMQRSTLTCSMYDTPILRPYRQLSSDNLSMQCEDTDEEGSDVGIDYDSDCEDVVPRLPQELFDLSPPIRSRNKDKVFSSKRKKKMLLNCNQKLKTAKRADIDNTMIKHVSFSLIDDFRCQEQHQRSCCMRKSRSFSMDVVMLNAPPVMPLRKSSIGLHSVGAEYVHKQ